MVRKNVRSGKTYKWSENERDYNKKQLNFNIILTFEQQKPTYEQLLRVGYSGSWTVLLVTSSWLIAVVMNDE